MAVLFLIFLRMLFPIVTAPIYIPTNSVGGFPILHIQHLLFIDFIIMAILTSVKSELLNYLFFNIFFPLRNEKMDAQILEVTCWR